MDPNSLEIQKFDVLREMVKDMGNGVFTRAEDLEELEAALMDLYAHADVLETVCTPCNPYDKLTQICTWDGTSQTCLDGMTPQGQM